MTKPAPTTNTRVTTIFSFLLFAAAAVAPSGETFTCTPTRVWDGDGPIWCAEGPRIRLSGIAAREMDGSCRTGQPCPDVPAEEARDALVNLVGRPVGVSREGHILVEGPAMTCRSEGSAGGAGRRPGACHRDPGTCPAQWSGAAGPCGGIGTGAIIAADLTSEMLQMVQRLEQLCAIIRIVQTRSR